jgi:microsomal dipeptidase-like Zn-dependent dipeptidase
MPSEGFKSTRTVLLLLLVTLLPSPAPRTALAAPGVSEETPPGWPHLRHPIAERPYTAAEIDRLKLLRHRFPDNPLLPKALTPVEGQAWHRRAAAQRALATKMAAGIAAREEIGTYYDYEDELVRARLQLVRFVLDEPQWPARTRERYVLVRAASEKQLGRIAARRTGSYALLERRQDAAQQPPPLMVARIEPARLEVMQGEVASFAARPGNAGPIASLEWTLPTDETATGPAVQIATRRLPAGMHDVLLTAIDESGRRSHDAAVLVVRPRPTPAVDLALESPRAVQLGQEQVAQGQVHVVAHNRGTATATGATVRFLLGKQVLHQVGGIALKPGERRLVRTPTLPADPLYGHDVGIVIEGPDPEQEDDPADNEATVAFGAPAPPAPEGEFAPPGVRFDGPDLQLDLELHVAPGVLEAAVNGTAPLPIDLGPVDGFADLHIHQMANLGYDGRLVWGAYDGPGEETALPQCSGQNHAVCWYPGFLFPEGGDIEFEVGSHAGLSPFQVPCVGGVFPGGPLSSVKGWHDNATSHRFKHWPVWRTVTHQQVFGEWLHSAHEQGLNLIVMSAVNSRSLCSILPFFNGFGGSHPLDTAAGIGITNTATDLAIRFAGSCNDMKNVRRQLLAAWLFDADHDWYEIALTPGHASQIVNEGKLAVVLAIEASDLFDDPATVESMRSQLDYFVDDLGVRSIQPVHQLDNAFGGASYFSGDINLIQWLDDLAALVTDILDGDQEVAMATWSAAADGFTRDGTGENALGFTDLGRQLLLDLMDRRLLVDLAHLSKPATDVAYNIAVARSHYPLYVSHTRYADLLGGFDDPFDDHLAKDWQTLQHVKELGGMVGLRTASRRVRTYTPAAVANNCPGSVRDFAQSYAYGALGYGIPQALASDMNGFIQQMRPRFFDSGHPKYDEPKWACGEDVTSNRQRRDFQDAQGDRSASGTGADFDLTGFGRIDQVGSLIADLRDNLGVETVQLEDSAEAFVQMWQRTATGFLRSAGDPCLDRSGIVGGPATGGTVTNPGCPPVP